MRLHGRAALTKKNSLTFRYNEAQKNVNEKYKLHFNHNKITALLTALYKKENKNLLTTNV